MKKIIYLFTFAFILASCAHNKKNEKLDDNSKNNEVANVKSNKQLNITILLDLSDSTKANQSIIKEISRL
jgi:ABC-type uncharacterized transport system auxiliary subunit